MEIARTTSVPDRPGAGDRSVRFSIIVAVYNRSDDLRRLLLALGEQSFPHEGFEVLVCDDGSTEDLRSLAEEAAQRLGLCVTFLRQGKRGPGPARNLGLANARGEITVFTDSDCLPKSGWLAALDSAFATQGLSLAGGAFAFREAEHLSGRCINFILSSSLGGGGVMDPRCLLHVRYLPVGGNLAVRRERAVDAGGFPENIDYCEDVLFSYRVSEFRPKAAFLPDAIVIHNERKRGLDLFLSWFERGRSRAWLNSRCGMKSRIHSLPAVLVASLVGSVLVAALDPGTLPVSLIPGAVYAAVLAILAIQGGIALSELRAVIAVPFYAVLMQVGYGLGYLAFSLGLVSEPMDASPIEWEALRAGSGQAGDHGEVACDLA